MSASRLPHSILLALLAVALLGYLVDLGGSSIWDANEAYYVETPREMLESGDYLNPSFNYEPRFNKPVLSYWIVAALYHVFGVSVTIERLAIAAGALITIGASFLLARAASAHAAAPLLAAAGLAANPRFFMFARRILIDVALAAFMTLVLLFFVLSERYPKHRRTLLIAMYVAVGCGVLAKGPVAAVLPALVFCAYLFAVGELRRIREMMIPAGVVIAAAVAAPWYVALYLQGGWTHISEFFIGENVARYTTLVGPQSRGPLFYVPVVLSDAFPWSLCLPGVIVAWFRHRRARAISPEARVRTILLLWVVMIVVFFSLSQTKQDLYIFPIVAAVAALGGDFVARALDPGGDGEGRWLAGALSLSGIALFALGTLVLYVFGRSQTVYVVDGTMVVGAIGAAGGAAIVALVARRLLPAAVVTLLGVLVAVNWTLVLRTLPSFEKYKPVAPLSEIILTHAQAGDVVAHYDVALPSMVFYVRRHIDVLFEREAFLDLFRRGRTVFAVLPEDRYEEMKGEIDAPICVLARRATSDVKLREILSLQPPPAVLLVSTRCPS